MSSYMDCDSSNLRNSQISNEVMKREQKSLLKTEFSEFPSIYNAYQYIALMIIIIVTYYPARYHIEIIESLLSHLTIIQ